MRCLAAMCSIGALAASQSSYASAATFSMPTERSNAAPFCALVHARHVSVSPLHRQTAVSSCVAEFQQPKPLASLLRPYARQSLRTSWKFATWKLEINKSTQKAVCLQVSTSKGAAA